MRSRENDAIPPLHGAAFLLDEFVTRLDDEAVDGDGDGFYGDAGDDAAEDGDAHAFLARALRGGRTAAGADVSVFVMETGWSASRRSNN